MEEHDSIEGYFKNKFKTCKWLCFQNTANNCHNKTYINKDFYEEHRSSCRKFRSNKKNICNPCEPVEETKLCPQTGGFGYKSKDMAYETAIPNTLTTSYEGLGSRAYNCKYTNDGEKIIVTTQCGTAIYRMDAQNQLELLKVILCNNIYWTITDTKLSRDNRFMLQVTMNQYVQLLDLEESRYSKEFNLGKDGGQQNQSLMNNMRVYSVDLSGNNQEMVAGCSKSRDGASAKIFDMETEQVKTSVICHKDDVNGICYLDKSDNNIFLTASDDGTSKLWDTRILKNNEPAGIFYGHVSGLTCVSSKEDSRYFVTNSKDQSVKVWDIRKFSTQKKNHPYLNYDYRCEVLTPTHIQEIKEYQKKLDDSVMTFWGHQVHMTLIRCYFSPLHGTGQRYVYSGSYDGRIYIYDTVTGENAVTLELPKEDDDVFHCPVVRDCSWHPYSQSLVNTSFLGGVYKWEYRDVRDLERIEDEEEERNDGEEEMCEDTTQAYMLCYKNNNVISCQSSRRNYS